MFIYKCVGYYDMDDKLHECGVVYDRKDDGKEEETISHGLCSKCFRDTENIAELFYNRVGSKMNIY